MRQNSLLFLRTWLAVGGLFLAAVGFTHAQFGSDKEYLSVVSDKANVRVSPEEDAEVLWQVWKYMPVEIIAYRGDWRKIRDLDGDKGWMHKATLGKIATVMVKEKDAKLRKTRGGKVIWLLDRGRSAIDQEHRGRSHERQYHRWEPAVQRKRSRTFIIRCQRGRRGQRGPVLGGARLLA